MDDESDYEYDEEEEYEYDDQQDDNEDLDDTPSDPSQSQNISVSTIQKSPKKSSDNFFQVPNDSYILKQIDDIYPFLKSLVSEVSTLLEISEEEGQVLLQKFKWDKEKLIDAYFNNPNKLRIEAGLDLYDSNVKKRLNPPHDATGDFLCRICYDEGCKKSTSFALGCNHYFCNTCYRSCLLSSLSDGPTVITTTCPEYKCKQIVLPNVFEHFFPPGASPESTNPPLQGDELKRYNNYYIKNFIEMSKTMKYCPSPNCDNVAIGSGITTIHCSCSQPFCFKCGEEAHDPCSCTQLSDWKDKCHNESETANWILANTRKCPNCNTRIEKNQGCNHITCSQCRHEFCWICMGKWEEHSQTTGGFYKCNRFESSELSTVVTEAQKAKEELNRYLHYYQRYHGHEIALKFALTKLNSLESKLLLNELVSYNYFDTQYLKTACLQVIECRRVLKYSYVLGYFLKKKTQEQILFEHQQEMLEKNTEKLHELTEESIESIDKIAVINLTRVTQKFLSSLLKNISGGVVTIDEELIHGLTSGLQAPAANNAPNTESDKLQIDAADVAQQQK